MANVDYHSDLYVQTINEYQGQLACLCDLVNHLLEEMEGPEWATSAGVICRERFSHLVESFPFPPSVQV